MNVSESVEGPAQASERPRQMTDTVGSGFCTPLVSFPKLKAGFLWLGYRQVKETTASLGCVSVGSLWVWAWAVWVWAWVVWVEVWVRVMCVWESFGLCECGPATSSKVLSFIWSVLWTDPGTRTISQMSKDFHRNLFLILKILVTLFSLIYHQFSNKRWNKNDVLLVLAAKCY